MPFGKDLLSALFVPAPKASRLQMNLLPGQVAHAPDVAAVIRHSTFETSWTARQVLGPCAKDNSVSGLLHGLQNQLFRRWQ